MTAAYPGMFRVGQRAYHTSHGSPVLPVEVTARVGVGVCRVSPPPACGPDVYESTLYFTNAEAELRSRWWRRAYKPAASPPPEAAPGPAYCHAGRDGDCFWERCPQLRDDEPGKTGRHCPIDTREEPI